MCFVLFIGTEANERLNRKNGRNEDNNNESKYIMLVKFWMTSMNRAWRPNIS